MALGYVGCGALSTGIECLEESPPYKNDNDEREATNRSILCPVSLRYSRQRLGPELTCFNSNSQLIRTAAFLYFLLSSRSLLEISPMRSRLSPRYSKSSMFFVMTLVTSFSSSLSLSMFCVARESWYVFFVRWMKVSNSTNAYGRHVGERYCCGW